MPGKVPGLKVELRDSKNRKLSSSSRRLSDASRSSIMSPTVLSAKVGTVILIQKEILMRDDLRTEVPVPGTADSRPQ